MPTPLISMLSLTDFNGNPLPDKVLYNTFDELMAEHGYVSVCNAHKAFDPVAFCRRLGPFVPNYNGAIVSDVRPEPGMDDVYHAGNAQGLVPHTEGYDFTVLPPRYVALWCVTPCTGDGGETTLADAYKFFSTLSDEETAKLKDRVFEWKAADGLVRLGFDLHTSHPVLEDTDHGLIVRFTCINMVHHDDVAALSLQERVASFFAEHHVAMNYERGDMLIWDNWRTLHSRNPFTDRGRHLRRIQIAVRM
jgi:alpha-ketoglutarate-dependent taurine dioxygenase